MLGAMLEPGRGQADSYNPLQDAFERRSSAQMPMDRRPPQRPLQTRRLAAPDFAALHEQGAFIAGVRPHREGGVRLEARPPFAIGDVSKIVVHNYGHGGAGISLSFAAAERARDLVLRASASHLTGREPASIAVLGAGVIGLTTAAALRDRFPSVPLSVYASAVEAAETTSYKAGGKLAHVSEFVDADSSAVRADMERLLSVSEDRFRSFARIGAAARYGIDQRPCYSLAVGNDGGNVRLSIGQATHVAREYQTWLVDPTRLLPTLRRELEDRDVRFHKRRFETLSDVYTLPEPVIVNCTGMGARDLFGDRSLVGRRGHLVRLRNPGRLRYMLASWCGDSPVRYLFARSDDIVIGGSLQTPNGRDAFDASDAQDVAICERILRNARGVTGDGQRRCG